MSLFSWCVNNCFLSPSTCVPLFLSIPFFLSLSLSCSLSLPLPPSPSLSRFRQQVSQLYEASISHREWSSTVSNSLSLRIRRHHLLEDAMDQLGQVCTITHSHTHTHTHHAVVHNVIGLPCLDNTHTHTHTHSVDQVPLHSSTCQV